MAEPARTLPDEPSTGAEAWRLALPPAVFLAHFALAYSATALACRFGWAQRAWAGVGLVPIAVFLLTAAAIALLMWARPRKFHSRARDDTDPYDPSARRHFMAAAARMTTWLSIGGVALVALTTLFARTCGAGL